MRIFKKIKELEKEIEELKKEIWSIKNPFEFKNGDNVKFTSNLYNVEYEGIIVKREVKCNKNFTPEIFMNYYDILYLKKNGYTTYVDIAEYNISLKE